MSDALRRSRQLHQHQEADAMYEPTQSSEARHSGGELAPAGIDNADAPVSGTTGFSRRAILAMPAILAFAGTAIAQEGTSRMKESKTIVAYLTRSGNTRVIAGTLQRALHADLFEIRTAHPYPEDYEQHVAQATRERDSGFEPPLVTRIENIEAYDEIFLGFPIWGETAPPPIRSFLKAHDLRGKTIRPFITHGGYGVGSGPAVLASHAPEARIEQPFVMEADQERVFAAGHGIRLETLWQCPVPVLDRYSAEFLQA